MSEFTCYLCKQTFPKMNNDKWNDFKAAEEFLDFYPEGKNDATEVLCDICNEEFKKWFATLTKEEKMKMRMDYENG